MAGGGSSEMRVLELRVKAAEDRVEFAVAQIRRLEALVSELVRGGPPALGKSGARAAGDGGRRGVVLGLTVPPRKDGK